MGTVDRFVQSKALPELMRGRDLELACAFAQTGTGGLLAATGGKAEASLVMSWVTAGVCAELDGREARLDSLRAQHNLGALGEGAVAEATDARLEGQRHHATAARRFAAGYAAMISRWGLPEDGRCPAVWEDEAHLYLLGLLSGVLSQVNDAASGGEVGVPLNTLLDVARGSECLDDERYWRLPSAIRGATWATVPGSVPEGIDPWALLAEAAEAGDAAGFGLNRALWVFTAANAGREDVLREALSGWSAAPSDAPEPEFALLDAYADALMLFEADQLWIAATGHRAPASGVLPEAQRAEAADPFGADDPFGEADPLAAPAPDDAPQESP